MTLTVWRLLRHIWRTKWGKCSNFCNFQYSFKNSTDVKSWRRGLSKSIEFVKKYVWESYVILFFVLDISQNMIRFRKSDHRENLEINIFYFSRRFWTGLGEKSSNPSRKVKTIARNMFFLCSKKIFQIQKLMKKWKTKILPRTCFFKNSTDLNSWGREVSKSVEKLKKYWKLMKWQHF